MSRKSRTQSGKAATGKTWLVATLVGLSGFFSNLAVAQRPNPYQLPLISTVHQYQALVQGDSSQALVDLAQFTPGLLLDIRYATSRNFTGTAVYDSPRAFARLPLARALQLVQRELNTKGLGLKIYDAYRPYQVTRKFWEVTPDKRYVASPRDGSRHNRGCAVDLTLIELATGRELPMPTEYDNFTAKAHARYSALPDSVLRNRDLLRQVMERHGFTVFPTEWWHFDLRGWKKYMLLDLSFEEVDALLKKK